MLVSLNWLRDYVALPEGLDPRALAERFTVTTAEVEGVHEQRCEAAGLIAAEVLDIEPLADGNSLFAVELDTGSGPARAVTAATGLAVGDRLVFAPPGARVPGIGTVEVRTVAGRASTGMIVPGDALGLAAVGQRALWLPPETRPGEPIDTAPFNDWILEIDNKSITNRPDLWGHYGIARELAAACRLPLAPYPVTPLKELDDPGLPAVPIIIDDPARCPRYSALRFEGVRPQPSPLWMQVRLAHVGQRPIDLLVDLTNYIMLDLGQPMHAFDGSAIDRIEVALAEPGERFTTLDGIERTMPEQALMIQCRRRSVALAGIMGGAETEITADTRSVLLESANFDAATIRRCAAALGHRTEASARFEKSQDPHNTILAIQRFVYLARRIVPDLRITSRLSDCFPRPPKPVIVPLNLRTVQGYLGRAVSEEQIRAILEPLGFRVTGGEGHLEVTVPSWRATRDISIEADLIEEVARSLGYDSIEPRLPSVTVRYAEPAEIARMERDSLTLLCRGGSYAEIHRPVWFEAGWLRTLGFEPGPCILLRNPVAAGTERLRTTLIPGMLAAVELNRHHLDRQDLLEIGSVFRPADSPGEPGSESRHLGLALAAPGRKAVHEDELLRRLKVDIGTWALQMFGEPVGFRAAASVSGPWENPAKTAEVVLGSAAIGRLTAVPSGLKRRIDEHLAAWAIAVAEIDLGALLGRRPTVRRLAPIPVFPRVQMDFSFLVPAVERYCDVAARLAEFRHPLLVRLAFVDSFEGGSVPAGKRSLTFRATIGEARRTLTAEDSNAFRQAFISYIEQLGYGLRT